MARKPEHDETSAHPKKMVKSKPAAVAAEPEPAAAAPLERADPHFEREAAKYDKPIPSREFILEFLRERGQPIPQLPRVSSLN